jgi:hypothetical protein
MWGTKRSKREEEVVEEEEEKEEKEEEEHGAWAECCESTRPGSTSSADASSCCSATMTDAPPATLPLLHRLCSSVRPNVSRFCSCFDLLLSYVYSYRVCRLDRLTLRCTYRQGHLVADSYFGFRVLLVWCGAS